MSDILAGPIEGKSVARPVMYWQLLSKLKPGQSFILEPLPGAAESNTRSRGYAIINYWRNKNHDSKARFRVVRDAKGSIRVGRIS